MALIPWKPFSGLENFFEDEDWLLPIIPRSQSNAPVMDVYETEKDIVAEVNLPGVDPNKIDVSVEDQVLRISGATEEKKEEKKKGYWRKEIRKGSFERAIRLPAPVKEDKVEAVYDKGVLKIIMPKLSSKPQKKKIKVKTKRQTS